jgi:hypothetical protein
MLGNSKCQTPTEQTSIAVATLYAKFLMMATKRNICSVNCERGIHLKIHALFTSLIATKNIEESALMGQKV